MNHTITTELPEIVIPAGMKIMADECRDVMTLTGFREMRTDKFVRQEGELVIILQKDGKNTRLLIPCLSLLHSSEYDLNRFLNCRMEGLPQWEVVYRHRQIELTFHGKLSVMTEEDIDQVFSLLRETNREYELVPVCQCCHKSFPVRAAEHEDQIMTLCLMCGDKIALQKKQADLHREHHAPWKHEKLLGVVPKHPVRASIRAGVFAGLLACQVGLIFTMIDFIVPVMFEFPWILGGIAGIFMMKWELGLTQLSVGKRLLIGNISALVTILIVSNLWWIFFKLLFLGLYDIMLPDHQPYVMGSVANVNIFLGLPGFFLAETGAYFILR